MLTPMNEDIARTCLVTDPRVKSFTMLSRHPGVAARPIIIDLSRRHSPHATLDDSELTGRCPSGIRCDFFQGVNPPAWGTTAGMDFTGRVVIITGAARGLGRASAARFYEQGASVAVNARDQVRAVSQELGNVQAFFDSPNYFGRRFHPGLQEVVAQANARSSSSSPWF